MQSRRPPHRASSFARSNSAPPPTRSDFARSRSASGTATAVFVAGLIGVAVIGSQATPVSAQTAVTDAESTQTDTEFTLSGRPNPALIASANELWLRRMYDVILHRVPDSSGLDYWLGRLASGGDLARSRVASPFLFSPEGAQGEVDRAYTQLLGRDAEPGGRAFWTNYLTVHPVTVLRSNLLSSDEILARSGSIEAWLDALYLELLGRPADPGGRDYWAGRARAGLLRYSIVANFYYSPESLGRRVDAIYSETLDRAPTATERTEGAAVILGQDERRLRVLALSSDEYYQQFLVSAATQQ